MKTIKYIAGALIAILLIITTVVLFNTLKSVPTYESTKKIDIKSIDHQGAVNRFAKSLMFKTIANYDDFPKSEYKRFHRFLENSFPLVHSTLKKEIVGGYSLLYTWKGTDSSKKPILFMGHQDVVPIAPGTLGLWTHPPFDGKAVDGFIWGRGAIDNKSGVMGIFEAVETLISDGFTPKQTIYLSFGHDEEIGGNEGAAKTVELLKSRGVKLDYVLDEGGIITNGMFP